MTYDFLKDFHRRAEIVAIVDFITTRVSKKTRFREYGLIKPGENFLSSFGEDEIRELFGIPPPVH